MRLLLDTNAFLWAWAKPGKLSSRARKEIEDGGNKRFLSCVSIWEIANKVASGKLNLPDRPEDFDRYCEQLSIVAILPIRPIHVFQLRTLPRAHGDPFDRMLVAQCQVEGLRLVSADSVIAEHYLPDVIW
ncbi:MAG: type II toxin-antitoxin system VapC family toxin [Acidobacteriota bacterium]|nr:type II toxin-antitoxin system VapC family toxin [Acidobacteriota bacterium]